MKSRPGSTSPIPHAPLQNQAFSLTPPAPTHSIPPPLYKLHWFSAHLSGGRLINMDFKAISAVVETDFLAVNELIFKQLHTHVPLIKEIGHYIIKSGGKRLRPLVCLLSARALGYEGNQHIDVAAVVEFLHT